MLPFIETLKELSPANRVALFGDSFKFFVECFWQVLHSSPLIDAPYIDGLCTHLEHLFDLEFLVLRKPRKIGASKICSVFFPAWFLATQNNTTKFLCASYSKDLAKELNISCRTLIESEEYQFCFGHRVKLDISNETELVLKSGGSRYTASVESASLGRGCNVLLMDDMNTLESTEGDREKVVKYFDGVLQRTIIGGQQSAILNLQQTTHTDCLSNVLLRRNPQQIADGAKEWHDLCLCFDATGGERQHDCPLWKDGRKKGEPIVPKGFFPDSLLSMQRADRFDWALQSQQDPIVGSGAWVTALPYFKIEKGLIHCGNEIIDPADCVKFATTDLSFCTHNNNDHSVWQTWLAYDKYLICTFNWRDKLSWNDVRTKFVEFYRTQQPAFVVVEAHGPQVAMADELQKFMTVRPFFPANQKKFHRAAKARVMIDNRQMFFIDDIELTREVLNYSPNARHDDMVDCIALAAIFGQGVAKKKPPTQAEIEEANEQRKVAEKTWYQKKMNQMLFSKC